MKIQLRNRHRLFWIAAIVMLPLIIAIGYAVKPDPLEAVVIEDRSDDCTYKPAFQSETEIARYAFDDGECGWFVDIEFFQSLRLPQLGVVVSGQPLDAINSTDNRDIVFVEGKNKVRVDILRNARKFYVTLVDLVHSDIIDQIYIDLG